MSFCRSCYAIICKQTTDVTGTEQLFVSIRSVDDDFDISEGSIGLFALLDTTSDTRYNVFIGQSVLHVLLPELEVTGFVRMCVCVLRPLFPSKFKFFE